MRDFTRCMWVCIKVFGENVMLTDFRQISPVFLATEGTEYTEVFNMPLRALALAMTGEACNQSLIFSVPSVANKINKYHKGQYQSTSESVWSF